MEPFPSMTCFQHRSWRDVTETKVAHITLQNSLEASEFPQNEGPGLMMALGPWCSLLPASYLSNHRFCFCPHWSPCHNWNSKCVSSLSLTLFRVLLSPPPSLSSLLQRSFEQAFLATQCITANHPACLLPLLFASRAIGPLGPSAAFTGSCQ